MDCDSRCIGPLARNLCLWLKWFRLQWVKYMNSATSQLHYISWREQVNFQWDDDEVRFVLDQLALLDFYSASSLKQQSMGRHVALLVHIILIPCQPVFALSPSCCIIRGGSKKYQSYILWFYSIGTRTHDLLHSAVCTRGEHIWKIYDLIIYLRAENVDPSKWHVCYIPLYRNYAPSPNEI